ncbi:MAG: hypothetical protein ABIC04_00355 [Nanoarchaeota archaeon]
MKKMMQYLLAIFVALTLTSAHAAGLIHVKRDFMPLVKSYKAAIISADEDHIEFKAEQDIIKITLKDTGIGIYDDLRHGRRGTDVYFYIAQKPVAPIYRIDGAKWDEIVQLIKHHFFHTDHDAYEGIIDEHSFQCADTPRIYEYTTKYGVVVSLRDVDGDWIWDDCFMTLNHTIIQFKAKQPSTLLRFIKEKDPKDRHYTSFRTLFKITGERKPDPEEMLRLQGLFFKSYPKELRRKFKYLDGTIHAEENRAKLARRQFPWVAVSNEVLLSNDPRLKGMPNEVLNAARELAKVGGRWSTSQWIYESGVWINGKGSYVKFTLNASVSSSSGSFLSTTDPAVRDVGFLAEYVNNGILYRNTGKKIDYAIPTHSLIGNDDLGDLYLQYCDVAKNFAQCLDDKGGDSFTTRLLIETGGVLMRDFLSERAARFNEMMIEIIKKQEATEGYLRFQNGKWVPQKSRW